MTIAQFFSKSTLVVITLLVSINLLYAQGVPDIPKELILKNKVKSLKVFLSTKGTDEKALTNLEVVEIKYNKNGDEIAKSIYTWYDAVDYTDKDTLIYTQENKLVKIHRKHNYLLKSDVDVLTRKLFMNYQSEYIYEYDEKGNCIKEFSQSTEGQKEEIRYVYDPKGRKIQKIKFGSEIDTTFFKYNSANQCIEEGRYHKEVCTYTKDGLLAKTELYQDSEGLERTLDKAWRTLVYSYNSRKQLVKEDVTHPGNQGNWSITYSYYSNGLLKDKIEDMNSSVYTYTTSYEYWD